MGIEISVIIPTYQRAEKAAACVRTLARQSFEAERYEVLVGLDGPDSRARTAIEQAWRSSGGRGGQLQVIECARGGLNTTRNALVAQAQGRVLLSLNDDVLADNRLLQEHQLAQARALELGLRGVCVSGSAEWVRPEPGEDTLMDRLVRETSMVFFHDQMALDPADPDKDWGFRHCYGLNFSVPRWALQDSGGFVAFPLTYGHDDIEVAWRCKRAYGFPVWYRPGASVRHDHRYRARDILAREHNLGVASYRFASRIPEFGLALFGRDVTSEAEIDYSIEFVRRERVLADRLRETFLALDQVPAGAVAASGPVLIRALYEQHLLLKRWTWRVGLLEAAGVAIESQSCAPPAAGLSDVRTRPVGVSTVRS